MHLAFVGILAEAGGLDRLERCVRQEALCDCTRVLDNVRRGIGCADDRAADPALGVDEYCADRFGELTGLAAEFVVTPARRLRQPGNAQCEDRKSVV